ncbi:TPA: hypothetical protein U1202_001330 [Streptococcus suis]|nr:hypothetical protein [Streptococcus suis]HEM5068708.1 hypothetical protein [Streptococcus suis]
MTNGKLGVLLVDVPEPRCDEYTYLVVLNLSDQQIFSTSVADYPEEVKEDAYKCTQEEAKKYPQFRWVALEELG